MERRISVRTTDKYYTEKWVVWSYYDENQIMEQTTPPPRQSYFAYYKQIQQREGIDARTHT